MHKHEGAEKPEFKADWNDQTPAGQFIVCALTIHDPAVALREAAHQVWGKDHLLDRKDCEACSDQCDLCSAESALLTAMADFDAALTATTQEGRDE